MTVVPDGIASDVCIGDLVAGTDTEGTPEELDLQREFRYSDEEPLEQSASGEEDPLVVPPEIGSMATARANTCTMSQWDRAVVSELEDFMFRCFFYGQYNPTTPRPHLEPQREVRVDYISNVEITFESVPNRRVCRNPSSVGTLLNVPAEWRLASRMEVFLGFLRHRKRHHEWVSQRWYHHGRKTPCPDGGHPNSGHGEGLRHGP